MQFFPANNPKPKKHTGGTRTAITKEIAAIAILVGFCWDIQKLKIPSMNLETCLPNTAPRIPPRPKA